MENEGKQRGKRRRRGREKGAREEERKEEEKEGDSDGKIGSGGGRWGKGSLEEMSMGREGGWG